LSTIFAVDVTAAECQCAHCGAIDRFARTRLYMMGPGVVARCAACEHVLLRLVRAGQRLLLEARGLTYLSLDTSQLQESGR
jgi:xanthine/CO dehydrogenase XdhC/CoxF family maturation factor